MRHAPIAVVEQAVPETLAAQINQHFQAAETANSSALTSAMTCGDPLIEAKRLTQGSEYQG